jgi:acetyl esterase
MAQEGHRLRLQLLVYPGVDMMAPQRLDTPSFLSDSTPMLSVIRTLYFYRLYLPNAADALDPRASPLRSSLDSLRGTAPALIIAAEVDVLRDEGVMYADRLREAGVPVQYNMYPGSAHAFFSMWMMDGARAAVRDASAALVAALANP